MGVKVAAYRYSNTEQQQALILLKHRASQICSYEAAYVHFFLKESIYKLEFSSPIPNVQSFKDRGNRSHCLMRLPAEKPEEEKTRNAAQSWTLRSN